MRCYVWFGLVWFGKHPNDLNDLKVFNGATNLMVCRFNVLKDFNIVKELFFFRIVHRSEKISQRNFIESTKN